MSNPKSIERKSSSRASSVESFKVMDILARANYLQTVEGKEVLHCEVGQPETGAPKVVSEAAVASLQDTSQVLGYTDAFGLMPLRSKIVELYETRYGCSNGTITESNIVITTGSSAGFLLAFTACFDVGDVVAVASSGYPCYRNILGALGCEVATCQINESFKLTATELQQQVQQRLNTNQKPIKGLILSSPSNPTGAMLDAQELNQLCDYCDQQNIQFISDEIYHGITYGKQEATALQFSKNAMIINSFSKYYSMSGWRLGWMVLPNHLIHSVNSLQQNMFINAPTVSQTAALKCWDADCIQELENHINKYKQSREIILDTLQSFSSFDIAPADGGFYVYIDLGDDNVATNYGSVAMCSVLLEEEYVAFTPGIDFEDPSSQLGDRRFRISYAGGVDTVREAMKRFQRFWPKWIARVQHAKKEQVK